MTAFTVWKFESPEGAQHAESLLEGAQADHLVRIVDHAVISWPLGAKHPTMQHGREETKRGAGWGALWGLLVGALFTVPVLGVAAGAALGAFSKATQGLGITEEQLELIRGEVVEGTSALFVVTEEGNLDRVAERFRGVHTKLVDSNLTEAERARLLEAFGE
ncbi:DUF1269 domain-containing protein [Nocardioides sp. MAHUQ-72]|uniref:DUF1269 domain-containing protein n=1 Tax=unclassified Nocardioides TaxID=2615069 RepID=UPI0036116745